MENHETNVHPSVEQSIYPDLNSFEPKRNKFKSGSSNSKSSYQLQAHSTPSESTSIASPKSMKRMVIFEWDDTLFPTVEFVKNKGAKKMNIKQLNDCGCRLYELLKTYMITFGASNIYIITRNGITGTGWIQQSLQMASELFQELNKSQIKPFEYDYFSIIDGLLIWNEIKIISARSSLYQCAMKHFWNNNEGIIISIGDSLNVSKHCQELFKSTKSFNLSLQTIKSQSEPTLDELMTEWEILMLIVDHLKLRNKPFDQRDLLSVSFTLKAEIQKYI